MDYPSSPSPKKIWTRASLKSVDVEMSNLFNQIRQSLDSSKFNQLKQNQFLTPLSKKNAATNSTSEVKTASAIPGKQSTGPLKRDGEADRSDPFDSQLKSPPLLMASVISSPHESSNSEPKVRSVEEPWELNFQTFTFGSAANNSPSALRSLKHAATSPVQDYASSVSNSDSQKTAHGSFDQHENGTSTCGRRHECLDRKVLLPVDEADKKTSAEKVEGLEKFGSQKNMPGLSLSSADVASDPPSFSSRTRSDKGADHEEKWKTLSVETEKTSVNHYSSCDFGLLSHCHGNSMLGKRWTKKEADDLIDFANTWIPGPIPKKRRVDEKR
mmetsp:Transcript_5950/g.13020  ORF Transcript_5950/g.13020 Transcript_5950/m.13020 type:complete len:328 (+) Transcript_5950:121-1104(+)